MEMASGKKLTTPVKISFQGFYLHFPESHFPLGHSELKEHLPSGALEHLPELHFAPLKPQSEAKEHFPPAASAHTPLLHFTFGLQSELKLHLP